jgi:hypothetical protein
MRRRGLAAATSGIAVATVLVLAAPASATGPRRGCPPPFERLGFEQQVALAMELTGLSREDAIEQLVQPAIDLIDRNGDQVLCFAFQNKVKGQANVLDNVSAAR